ncbi:MAG: DnaJ domain-containing protein [Desulfamplus sp.]|nr:DnaJ domain-containing protein [Desulfamplus sp.]
MNVAISFKMLGLVVRSDIGIAEVKRAYRTIAKKCHPDRFNNNPVLKKQAESRMKDINLAFRIACDFVNSLKKDENAKDEKEEHQKGAGDFDANFGKAESPVSHFFSWLKNIMASNVLRSSSLDAPIQTQNQVRSDAKPISTKESSINRKQKSVNFEDVLKRSSELKEKNKYSKIAEQSNFSENIFVASRKSSFSSNKSLFRYFKCKKKFINSYIEPIEKISPISNINKI